MTTYRVTVDYGDDRIRTYSVDADSEVDAERIVLDLDLLTVAASDDWDEHADVEPDACYSDGEW